MYEIAVQVSIDHDLWQRLTHKRKLTVMTIVITNVVIFLDGIDYKALRDGDVHGNQCLNIS